MEWIKDALDLAEAAGKVLFLLAAVFGATRWGKKLRLEALAAEWERIREIVGDAVRATEQLHARDAEAGSGGQDRSVRKRDEAMARAKTALGSTRISDDALMDLVEAAVHDLKAAEGAW